MQSKFADVNGKPRRIGSYRANQINISFEIVSQQLPFILLAVLSCNLYFRTLLLETRQQFGIACDSILINDKAQKRWMHEKILSFIKTYDSQKKITNFVTFVKKRYVETLLCTLYFYSV